MVCKIVAGVALLISVLHLLAYQTGGRGYRRCFGGSILLRAVTFAYFALFFYSLSR